MDTLTVIIAFGSAIIILCVFPIVTMANTNENVTQLVAQEVIDNLMLEVAKTGKLTDEEVENALASLPTTESYDLQLEFQILDENPAKKTSQTSGSRVGEGTNRYYTVTTTQILDEINENGEYILKEGDIATGGIKNTSPTILYVFMNIGSLITGDESYSIVASRTIMVTKNGK